MTKDLPIYNPAHPHFASWRACIDSLRDKGVPLEVQSDWPAPWRTLPTTKSGMPDTGWCAEHAHRIKPPERKMVTRTITYPEPMKEAPERGSVFWVVLRQMVLESHWHNFECEHGYLKAGICYDNEADAQARWDVEYGGVK